eukprot:2150158-Amphidinium_carterae.1
MLVWLVIKAVISIVFVIFGILLASSLISTLAALLIDFQMNERESTERMRTLRRASLCRVMRDVTPPAR